MTEQPRKTMTPKSISVDEIEQAMNDNRPVEILPDGSVVLGEQEEAPTTPLTYRQPGLGDNY